MTDQMPTSRNRKLLLGLAGAGLFLLGFQAGNIFSHLYPLVSATPRPHTVRMAVIDEDGGAAAARIKIELCAIKTLSISEYPDRSAARRDLDAAKIDIVVCLGPNFSERVNDLDLADVLELPRGRLDGKLQNLGIEVQTGALTRNAAESIEVLIYSFAVRTITTDVLERDPKLALKYKAMARQKASRSREALDVDAPQNRGGTP